MKQERQPQTKTAYLFDVDGVLTDPIDKKVNHIEIFSKIIELLNLGEVVGLNSGRSLSWMLDRIVNPMIEKSDELSIFTNFIAIGEKGGTWITFDSDGVMSKGKSSEFAVSDKTLRLVNQLVTEKFADCMFVDSTKETMISIEMVDGFDLDLFSKKQQLLESALIEILAQNEESSELRIDLTTIATDIEHSNEGKAFGTSRFLQFLSDRQITPELFIVFGDSYSDFEMADELHKRNLSVRFVYVGNRLDTTILNKEYPIEIFPGFSLGTLQFLNRI